MRMHPVPAIYTRIDAACGLTARGQESEVRAAMGNPLESIVFGDDAPGDTLERDGLRRLIAAIHAGTVSAVYVWSADRIATNHADALAFHAHCRARGIPIHDVMRQRTIGDMPGFSSVLRLYGI